MDKEKGKLLPSSSSHYKNLPRHKQDYTSSQTKPNYRILSPYIQKVRPLHICFLNTPIESLHVGDPAQIASTILPSFAHFFVQSRKTRYYQELILQDTDSCLPSHNLSSFSEALPRQYPDTLETCLAYSKMIVTKVLNIQEYGNPNTIRRLSKIHLPSRIPYEYNYWDYLDAWIGCFFIKIILDSTLGSFVLIYPRNPNQLYFLSQSLWPLETIQLP